MLGTALLYFLIVLVFVATVAPENYSSATLVDVGRTLAGPLGAIVITLAAIFSIGGNLAASMLAAPRIIFSMAENRMLPAWFGHIHRKYATPDNSILLMGAMALFMALTGTFVKLAIASSLVRLLGYIVCIAALPAVRRKAGDSARATAFRLKGGYTIPLIALAICFWLLVQSERESWIAVIALLAVGWLFYALELWSNSRRQQ
jgi:amino acid transporter